MIYLTNNYTTLDDVKRFIKGKLGRTWAGAVCVNGELIDVENFEQLAEIEMCKPIFEGTKSYGEHFRISTTKFQLITQEYNDVGDGFEYDMFADYSKDWMKYQCSKYGDEFKTLCLEQLDVERCLIKRDIAKRKDGLKFRLEELEKEERRIDEAYTVLKGDISTAGLKQ